MTYDNQDPYANYDPNGLSPQELLAQINSLRNRIASTVTKLGVAESQIAQTAEQITLTVRKDEIISVINQSAEAIDIIASKINLTGAVTVLSDISGNLGTITAGIIDIDEGIRVGKTIFLGEGFDDSEWKSIYFNADGWIDSSDEHFSMVSMSKLTFHAQTTMEFHSPLIDFKNKPITGLNVTVNFG